MSTNFGLFAGAYQPNDVTVCHASPISYPHFEAICDVPVFPAIVYHLTQPAFANHFCTPSTSMAVTCVAVISFMTRLRGVGTVSILFPFG